MLLAEKYEEIYPNSCNSYTHLADKCFTVPKLQLAERKIGLELEFKFEPYHTPVEFLKLFGSLVNLPKITLNYANMLLHILMFDLAFLKYKPSLLAVATIIVARQIMLQKEGSAREEGGTKEDHSNEIKMLLRDQDMSVHEVVGPIIDEIALKMINCIDNSHHYKRLIKKFKLKKYDSVANMLFEN